MTLQLKLKKQLDSELLSVRPPVRVKHILARRYHRKRLFELSLKSLGQIPQLDELTEEQKAWMHFRLTHGNTWPRVRENKIGDWKHWS